MFTEITTAATAFKATIDILSGLSQSLKKLKDIQDKSAQIEMSEKLLEVKAQVIQHKENYNILAEENQTLKKKCEFQDQLIFESPFYWHMKEGRKEGPFCQHCYDKDGKPVRLVQNDAHESESYYCTVCKNHPETIEAKKRRIDNLKKY